MTRRNVKETPTAERQRLEAHIARLEAKTEALARLKRPEYEKLEREVERMNAENVKAGEAWLAAERAWFAAGIPDAAAFAAFQEAQRRAQEAERALKDAVDRLVALGNWIHHSSYRAGLLRQEIARSYQGATRGRRNATKPAQDGKRARAAAVDGVLGPEARAMKRRNPQMSNATIAERLSRRHFVLGDPGDGEKPMTVTVGPKRVARWLASG
jgi:hypothetical protein